ncbi:MAG: UDP-N-acetylmuramoyl-L-alanyl-D-glutamate--2,6-diaminopimelate ligase [Oscillospiraceae bacterium]|nr:UDP-N-acetylmuramoyl-L-alanyl-D-glutamate--2,6-diaminopimelate ligase [Oscillospiraceae bacterium]
MLLGKLVEKIDIIEISETVKLDEKIGGICYNSAEVRQGDVFVAIKGFKTDGHDFMDEAVKKGASCVICENAPSTDIPHIITKNSRKTLAEISAAMFDYPAKKMKLIGVTGTNGKTSTTHILKFLIEKCSGKKVGLIGTIENLIGDDKLEANLTTPDSYELQEMLGKMVNAGCQYVVMEVSSHALTLDRVHGINYDIAVFTNLSPEHLDFHTSINEYANAKSILFTNAKQSVINIDDDYADLMIGRSAGAVTTYAINRDSADLTGKDIKLYPDKVEYCLVKEGLINRVRFDVPGMFSVYNSLAATAAAQLLGFSLQDAAAALSLCPRIKGRAEVLPTDSDYTIIIDYAHTPDALENIIKATRANAAKKIITVFGCGGDRDKTKRAQMGKIAAALSDYVFVTSDNPRTEDPQSIINDILAGMENTGAQGTNYTAIADRKSAICKAVDMLNSADVLIIAGKGHETYQILKDEKIRFDDREVVKNYLSQADK